MDAQARTRAATGAGTRFTITLPPEAQFSNVGRHVVAMSPDGTRITYAANFRLYCDTRWIELEDVPVRGTEEETTRPDGVPSSLPTASGSVSGTTGSSRRSRSPVASQSCCVRRRTHHGGPVGRPTTRSRAGRERDLARVGNGGKPENLVTVSAGQSANGPQLLPGGRAILFTLARDDDWDAAQIVVQSLDTGMRRIVMEGGSDARYVSTGHLVYARGSTLLGVPFDVATLAVTGGAVPLVEGVARAQGVPGRGVAGYTHFAMSVTVP